MFTLGNIMFSIRFCIRIQYQVYVRCRVQCTHLCGGMGFERDRFRALKGLKAIVGMHYMVSGRRCVLVMVGQVLSDQKKKFCSFSSDRFKSSTIAVWLALITGRRPYLPGMKRAVYA
jgi:hypothetical protein